MPAPSPSAQSHASGRGLSGERAPWRAPNTVHETTWTWLQPKPPEVQVLAHKNRVSVRPPRAWHGHCSPRGRLISPESPSGAVEENESFFKGELKTGCIGFTQDKEAALVRYSHAQCTST